MVSIFFLQYCYILQTRFHYVLVHYISNICSNYFTYKRKCSMFPILSEIKFFFLSQSHNYCLFDNIVFYKMILKSVYSFQHHRFTLKVERFCSEHLKCIYDRFTCNSYKKQTCKKYPKNLILNSGAF